MPWPSVPQPCRNEAATANIRDGKLDGLNVPRYHFDLVDSKAVTLEGGAELADDIQALDVAEEIARRLSKGVPNREAVTSPSSPIRTAKKSAACRWMSCTEAAI
jgi:hypothetical protein